MFEIVQAPAETKSKGIRLFIAGGIRNCPPWQDLLIEKLQNDERLKNELKIETDPWEKANGIIPRTEEEIKIIIFNPRCKEIPDEVSQIMWEYNKLDFSDLISFWFSEGSVNPITLFEYGSYLKSKKDLVIGCHENYERKLNIITQTALVASTNKSTIKINESFEDFYNQLVETLIYKIANYRIRNLNKN